MRRLTIAIALASCSKTKPPPDAATTAEEREQRRVDATAVDYATETEQAIPTIRAALVAGKLSDAGLSCEVSDHVVEFQHLIRFKRVASDFRQLCGYDVPIARMKQAVEQVEAASKAPDAGSLAGTLLACTDREIGGEYVAGREAMKAAKRETEESLDLVRRWGRSCPQLNP